MKRQQRRRKNTLFAVVHHLPVVMMKKKHETKPHRANKWKLKSWNVYSATVLPIWVKTVVPFPFYFLVPHFSVALVDMSYSYFRLWLLSLSNKCKLWNDPLASKILMVSRGKCFSNRWNFSVQIEWVKRKKTSCFKTYISTTSKTDEDFSLFIW